MATGFLPVFDTEATNKYATEHIEDRNAATNPRKGAGHKNVKTRALVVEEPKADFSMQTVYLDEVREDELLIDMKFSGICHTDIVLQQGLLPMVEFPAIFGHEGAGYIVEIGSGVKNKELKVGDAVLLSFNTCGKCNACTENHPAYCHVHPETNHNAVRLSDRSTPGKLEDGRSVRSQYFGHSSFANMSVVNEKCVVKCAYPENMPIYAPIGCGFQTGAGTVLNVLKPKREESIVIFGCGGVGLSALMAAAYLKVDKIIGIDLQAGRLELAKELGATHVINPKEDSDVVGTIKKLTNGGANYSIDCTGLLKIIEQCIECIGPLGTAATVGVPPPGGKIEIDALTFLLLNKKYIGVIEGDSVPSEFVPKLVELHQQGHFPIDKLCKTYAVADLADAIHDMHAGTVIKPVIAW